MIVEPEGQGEGLHTGIGVEPAMRHFSRMNGTAGVHNKRVTRRSSMLSIYKETRN